MILLARATTVAHVGRTIFWAAIGCWPLIAASPWWVAPWIVWLILGLLGVYLGALMLALSEQ
jgi:hypothetical protein